MRSWLRARPLAAVAVAAGSAVAVALATVIAVSCLPDLSPLPVSARIDPGDVNMNPCGDGVIDIEAGEQCDPGAIDASTVCSPTCTVVCEGGLLDDATDHCYTAFAAGPGQPTNYTAAKTKCGELGGHVVTFVSEAEYQKIAQWYAADGGYWIGLAFDVESNAYVTSLAQEPKEPGWLPPTRCAGCYAHLDAGPDATGEQAVGKPCLVGNNDAAAPWSPLACTMAGTPVGVICEREPIGTHASHSCNDATCIVVRATFNRKHYIYVTTPDTAANAQKSCRENGGTLVVLESREEREQLAAELVNANLVQPNLSAEAGATTAPAIWIGLTRTTATAPWFWDNDASIDVYPLPWGDREPRTRAMRPPGLWTYMSMKTGAYDTELAHADDGMQKLTYVCEIPN